jgi:hypothetical protein
MSYSYSVKGTTKQEALEAAEAEMDRVVGSQPIHAKDRDQALANVSAAVALLMDDTTKEVCISANGSLGWDGDDSRITSANINVGAWLQKPSA